MQFHLDKKTVMLPFQIKTLDHVALRVRDIEISAQWYERVLGLRRIQPEAWGPFPIFMVAENGTGVALFPPQTNTPESLPEKDWIRGDHYAFRVESDHFEAAQQHLKDLEIPFEFQDHHYFYSIYFLDPDGHELELTTQVKWL